jgi:eukaryotic-like serine/threonine-protein kinase
MIAPLDLELTQVPPNTGLDGSQLPHDRDDGEEWLERMMIVCDLALTSGLTAPDLANLLDHETSEPETCDRLNRAVATLALLQLRWPREHGHRDAAAPGGGVHRIRRPQLPGMSLGRYEILGLLGAGGHGIVFVAYDPSLRRKVALKVPRLEALSLRSSRARFLREAQAVARLDHPGIVPIHDFGMAGPVCYMAMAHVDGPNLGDWLDSRNEPLDPELATRLTLALTEAVSHAHTRGVLHCDLKPANVLLESKNRPAGATPGVPRITDFGLATLLDEESDSTRARALPLGTPGFAAPELTACARDRIGPPADIYGLGAILYALLTGRPPARPVTFRLEDSVEQSELPGALNGILARSLQELPDDRYPTAEALADDLRRFLAGERVRPRGSIARRIRWTCSG